MLLLGVNQKGFIPLIFVVALALLGVLTVSFVSVVKKTESGNLIDQLAEKPRDVIPTLTAVEDDSFKVATPTPKGKTPTATSKSGLKTSAPTPRIATPTAISTSNIGVTPTPTAVPTAAAVAATPTSTSAGIVQATSCSSVSVSGGTYGGVVGGKALYYVASGGSLGLTANTTPTNGTTNWKIASFSSALPNGGSFSVNNSPTTTYTTPTNSSGSDQGVEIRGDISESPNAWLYCPPITIGVHSN